MFKFLKSIFFDERGEEETVTGTETDTPPLDTENKDQGPADEGKEAPPQPKYGEFGDTPTVEQIYEALTKTKTDLTNFTKKSGMTEKNLATLRKTLEGHGIRPVQDEDGQVRLEVIDQKPKTERKTRFTKDHEALFDQEVLEAVRNLIQDTFDESLETREKTLRERYQRTRAINSVREQTVNLMFEYFPQLDGKWEGEDEDAKPTNKDFDAIFHKRAEEIWKEKYHRDPRGELIGALEAAKELNILPKQIAKAKEEGYNEAKTEKKILGSPGGGSKPAGGGKTLSKAEYLKLPSEERDKYDKEKVLGG